MLVFWDLFLFDQTSTCDNSIDCFVGVVSVNNCSLYNKNHYIVCYDLNLSFGTGFAALGGLVTAFRLLLKLTVKVNLTIYNKIPLKLYRVFRRVVMILPLLLFSIGCVYLSRKSFVRVGPFFIVQYISISLGYFAAYSTFVYSCAIHWHKVIEEVEALQALSQPNNNDPPSDSTVPLLRPITDQDGDDGANRRDGAI